VSAGSLAIVCSHLGCCCRPLYHLPATIPACMAVSTVSEDSNDTSPWSLVPEFERCPHALDAASDDTAPQLAGLESPARDAAKQRRHAHLGTAGAGLGSLAQGAVAGPRPARHARVAGYVMRPHDFVRQSIHRTWRKLTTKLLVLWRGQLIPNTSLEDVEDLLCKWASDRA